jgi:hypothetical protein
VAQVPDMSFPVSSLLRAHAFQQDWAAVDRLLALAATRQLREFQDGLLFIRAKRDLAPANIDDSYRAAESARLGPVGTSDDITGPDGYRTSLLFQAGMPELRNDPRFARLCTRLGLVEFWMATCKWPDCADEVSYDFKAESRRAQHIPKEDFGFWRARAPMGEVPAGDRIGASFG